MYQPSIEVNLVPEAALYGPNASGKSNILLSLQWVENAIASSLRFWEYSIPVTPFAFSDGAGRPSAFELEMLVDGVRYEYYLEADSDQIRYESVYATTESTRICLFEREEQSLTFNEAVKRQAAIEELLTPRTLVMSVALRYQEPALIDLINSIIDMQFLGESVGRDAASSRARHSIETQELFDDAPRQSTMFDYIPQQTTLFEDESVFEINQVRRERALAWLQMADLGISDVRVVKVPGVDRRSRKKVQLLHTTKRGKSPLDFAQESEGTKSWFRLIGPAIVALESGSPLVFDELDASLHPVLSAQLLNFFRDPEMNTKGAQLLFSSHDTSLMQYLKSDEIWLTEKHEGATSMHSLVSFDSDRVRRSINLESGYLHGLKALGV